MSRIVRVTVSGASSIAAAVAGAPRATLAVVLVATLVFGSLLPSLRLVNSEDMWLPEGERTDAYHELAATLGATEFVGVLAQASDGNVVEADDLAALLSLEDAAVRDPAIAEAFRFPRDPDANALSLADLIAEADAVLAHRTSVFSELGGALNRTVGGSSESLVASRAADHAAWVVALLTALREESAARWGGTVPHALLDALLPELEVALLSGTDAPYKARTLELLLAAADFALWSRDQGTLSPSDPALVNLRSLLQAASALLASNASAAMASESLGLLAKATASSKSMLALDSSASARASTLLSELSAGYALASNTSAAGAYADALGQLVDSLLYGDQLLFIADEEAAAGLSAMAENLSVLLGSDLDPAARARSVAIMHRLFQTLVLMDDRGLDLSVPQSDVTYNAYAAALNENGTILGDPSVNHSRKQQAASDLASRTYGFIATNINLNETGIFTSPASFQRLMTMLSFLNDTFVSLVEVLSSPGQELVLDRAAQMVSAEVLHVLNASAPLPHKANVTLSSRLEQALEALRGAVEWGGSDGGAPPFERAAGRLLFAFDFPSLSTLTREEENLFLLSKDSLARASRLLSSGEPEPAKAGLARVASSAFALPAGLPSSTLPAPSLRSLLTLVEREDAAIDFMVTAGQNPGLFARMSRATLDVFIDGLASPSGGASGTSPALLRPFAAIIAPVLDVVNSKTVSSTSKDLLIALAFQGAQLVETHLVAVPSPRLSVNHTEARARLLALGDEGVQRTLGVLLGTVASVPPALASVPAADTRFTPFLSNVSRYDPGLEAALRSTLGPLALRLLPNNFQASGAAISASGTVVLFLFNASLDRPTLGARESEMRELAASSSTDALSLRAFGYGLMWYDTQREMDLSVVLFSLTMLVVMGATLWVVYRSLFDVLITLALLGFTVVWVLGTASLIGIAINPVTQVIPVLLIGLAEDYAVHITIGYRRKRGHGETPSVAALAAVLGIGGVLLVATTTNGLAFLSFGGSTIELIKDFGTLMALGLLYSFILAITFIPAATVWWDRRGPRGTTRQEEHGRAYAARKASSPDGAVGAASDVPGRAERALQRTVETAVRHPWTTLLFVVLLTAASGLGATTLSTTFSYDEITAKDLEVVRTLNFEQDHYKASIQRVFILVDGQVDDPAVFLELRDAPARAADDPYVVMIEGRPAVTTIATHIEDLAARIRLEGPSAPGYTPAFVAAYAAADANGDGHLDAADNLTREGIGTLYSALLDDPSSTAGELVRRGPSGFDGAAVRFEAVRAVEHGDELTKALEADAAVFRSAPANASVSSTVVTGLPLLNREVMEAVQVSGWQSIIATVILAILLLGAFFYITFRSAALGVLTIAPTLIAVTWTLGAMVLAGLSLTMMTVMIATTTVGMGDLYAIHVSYSFYREVRRRKDPLVAVHEMIHEAGAPLLEASFTTALGFLILVFAPVPAVQAYGLIFAASIVFAFLYSIVVMPILVLLFARATHRVGADAPSE